MDVTPTSNFASVLQGITHHNLGIVPVLSPEGALVGASSDGDIRRALLRLGDGAFTTTAAELMNRSPKTISENSLAIDAVGLIKKNQITQLFVMSANDSAKLIGLVRQHDLLAAKIV